MEVMHIRDSPYPVGKDMKVSFLWMKVVAANFCLYILSRYDTPIWSVS